MGRVSASHKLRDWKVHRAIPNFEIERRQAIIHFVFRGISRTRSKSNNECGILHSCFCKGYGLGFFAGTLVTAYAAQIFSPRQIAWGAVALEALATRNS